MLKHDHLLYCSSTTVPDQFQPHWLADWCIIVKKVSNQNLFKYSGQPFWTHCFFCFCFGNAAQSLTVFNLSCRWVVWSPCRKPYSAATSSDDPTTGWVFCQAIGKWYGKNARGQLWNSVCPLYCKSIQGLWCLRHKERGARFNITKHFIPSWSSGTSIP